jgi:hypothetical protein
VREAGSVGIPNPVTYLSVFLTTISTSTGASLGAQPIEQLEEIVTSENRHPMNPDLFPSGSA